MIPACRRQKQVELQEFRLVYLHSEFQVKQGYVVRPCLKKTNNKKINKQVSLRYSQFLLVYLLPRFYK